VGGMEANGVRTLIWKEAIFVIDHFPPQLALGYQIQRTPLRNSNAQNSNNMHHGGGGWQQNHQIFGAHGSHRGQSERSTSADEVEHLLGSSRHVPRPFVPNSSGNNFATTQQGMILACLCLLDPFNSNDIAARRSRGFRPAILPK